MLTWLVLAAILYRGLIPAGFMPAVGEAAAHGGMVMLCPHGDMAMPGHDGKGSGSASIEQCPFGAAVGPALTSETPTLALASLAAAFRPEWSLIPNRGVQPHLQPPARGPPASS
jgi:hypothetical protein